MKITLLVIAEEPRPEIGIELNGRNLGLCTGIRNTRLDIEARIRPKTTRFQQCRRTRPEIRIEKQRRYGCGTPNQSTRIRVARNDEGRYTEELDLKSGSKCIGGKHMAHQISRPEFGSPEMMKGDIPKNST